MGSQLARRWEALSPPVQFAIAWPATTLVLWVLHITLLNQPTLRGLVYGIFWGTLATLALLYATANEVRRRREREDAR